MKIWDYVTKFTQNIILCLRLQSTQHLMPYTVVDRISSRPSLFKKDTPYNSTTVFKSISSGRAFAVTISQFKKLYHSRNPLQTLIIIVRTFLLLFANKYISVYCEEKLTAVLSPSSDRTSRVDVTDHNIFDAHSSHERPVAGSIPTVFFFFFWGAGNIFLH